MLAQKLLHPLFDKLPLLFPLLVSGVLLHLIVDLERVLDALPFDVFVVWRRLVDRQLLIQVLKTQGIGTIYELLHFQVVIVQFLSQIFLQRGLILRRQLLALLWILVMRGRFLVLPSDLLARKFEVSDCRTCFNHKLAVRPHSGHSYLQVAVSIGALNIGSLVVAWRVLEETERAVLLLVHLFKFSVKIIWHRLIID